MLADEPVIRHLTLRLETRTSQLTRRDYDFEQPKLLLEVHSDARLAPQLEDYDYPGRFTARTRGRHLARRALERHRRQLEGRSDQPRLLSGHLLEIAEHPRREWNDLWLLREIRHEGRQPQVLEESTLNLPSPADKGAGVRVQQAPPTSTRATATASPPPHGTYPSARRWPMPSRACSAARAPWSPARPARRSTATVRPREGAVPLGPRRPGRRHHQLLASRVLQLGRRPLRRHRHPARRHGSAGHLP